MNGTDGLPLRIWRLMDAHLNGTVTVEETHELDALLVNDDSAISERACRTFLEYTRIHAELHLLAAARRVSYDDDGLDDPGAPGAPPEPPQLVSTKTKNPRPAKSPFRGLFNVKARRNGSPRFVEAAMWMVMLLGAGTVAGLIVIVGILLNGIHVHVDQPGLPRDGGVIQTPPQATPASPSESIARGPAAIAELTREVRCHWVSRENSHRPGDQLMAGEQLALAAGVVELRFGAGVRVVLQGPACAELTSAAAMRLQSGKMTAEILRPEARGFQVQTPKGKVVDLGTEFGIEVTPSQDVEVHVFKGEVVVKQSADASAAGGNHVFRNQGLRMESGFAGPQLFEELGESFIRTIDDADRDKHVVAYWRFEDHPVGEAVPDTSGNRKAVRGTVDSSFNGNDLFTYSAASRPRFSADVPVDSVLLSGASNRGCLDNSVPPVDGAPTRDLYTHSRVSHAAPIDIQTIKLAQWTIEASVKVKVLNMGSQTFVGRDGGRGAVMAFRINAQDRFEIFFSDVNHHVHTAVAKMPVKANQWYHLAAVSDGLNLRLYVLQAGGNERDGRGYHLRASSKLNPARGPTALGPTNPDAQWSVGRGRVNRLTCEWFQGWIDEVRICDVALEPGNFLFAPRDQAERLGENVAKASAASTKASQETMLNCDSPQ